MSAAVKISFASIKGGSQVSSVPSIAPCASGYGVASKGGFFGAFTAVLMQNSGIAKRFFDYGWPLVTINMHNGNHRISYSIIIVAEN
jgi:hypothetical protein